MNETNYTKPVFILLLFLSFTAGFAVLKLTSSFLIPIVLSLLVSFVFYPLLKKLSSWHVPWILGIAACLVISGAAFFIIGNLLYSGIKVLVTSSSKYEMQAFTVYSRIAEFLNLPFNETSSLFENMLSSLGVRNFLQEMLLSLGSMMVSFVKVFFMIALMAIFLTVELKSMPSKINSAFNEKLETGTKIIFIGKKIIKQITHYLSIKFMLSVLTGVLVFTVCSAFSLEAPVIWGFLAFALNFIPNFGAIFSWAITSVFAVTQFYPSLSAALALSIILLVLNLLLGSLVEPRCLGSGLGISPFIILVSLSLWSWLWGFTGMILSVPLMVIMKIIFENTTFLKPLAVLMGTKARENQVSK
ncbi:MAG: AI-2E family transporter [Treponema sp.]|nr:AI-2E family transporter [Treponema sp.]